MSGSFMVKGAQSVRSIISDVDLTVETHVGTAATAPVEVGTTTVATATGRGECTPLSTEGCGSSSLSTGDEVSLPVSTALVSTLSHFRNLGAVRELATQ